MERDEGGPFGAVVVRNGVIVGSGHNSVVAGNDPTAHAEMNAIREAAAFLSRYDLSDCEIFTTCEPCPMCYGAIHWARIGTVHRGAGKEDAAELGFDDLEIYADIARAPEEREIIMDVVDRDACLQVFQRWNEKDDRVLY
ncbi:MAG: nucleoside deaminase [Spirochaetes bacterium]|nr:nucleoside deaminase [Spirochaetota bacterium]